MLCCPSLFGVKTLRFIGLRILDSRGFSKELPFFLNLPYKINKIVVMGLRTDTHVPLRILNDCFK